MIMNTVDFSGIKVDNITLGEAVAKIEEFLRASSPHLIVTPNPEMIVAAQKDQELKEIINNASLRLPDGISMVVVSRILGRPLRERVTGIDFLLKAVELSSRRGYKLFLLGGKPGVAQEAGLKLIEQFPGLNIVGTHDGYFDKDIEPACRSSDEHRSEGRVIKVIKVIKDTKPDILFAGLGAGRQEKWLAKYLKELNVPVCVGVGGSFDVISGKKKRAPKWIQSLYIEWLYRLVTEPERWKRQLALPKFLWLMCKFHASSYDNI